MDTVKLLQRRQFVVDPKLQYGLIFKCIVHETVILVISLFLLAFLFNTFINISLPVSVETGGVVSFGAFQSISLYDEIELVVAVLFLSVIIGSIGMYFFGASFSNKMAGPVYRLRSFIAGMSHGDLDGKVSLRQKDYFQPLATDINCLRHHWHDSVLQLQAINKQLTEGAGEEQKELLQRSNTILSDLYKKVS